jgi:hypothetical protein
MADPLEIDGNQSAKPDADQQSENYVGSQDITRPRNQLDIRYRYRSSGQPENWTQQGRLLVRLTTKVKLGEGWRLGLLAEAPFQDRTTKTTETSDAGFTTTTVNKYGIGDAALQGFLAHDLSKNLAVAFGARGEAPSGSGSLGTGKWQFMPGLGMRYSFTELGPDTFFTPVIRYALSVAGDPDRRNIRQLQISPSFNIGLSDRWFVTFYPSYDVRINVGPEISGQRGRLFVPFDVAFGREIAKGLQLSLEVAVPIIRDFPVYNFKTELKIMERF